jgi:hypothetical protein
MSTAMRPCLMERPPQLNCRKKRVSWSVPNCSLLLEQSRIALVILLYNCDRLCEVNVRHQLFQSRYL